MQDSSGKAPEVMYSGIVAVLSAFALVGSSVGEIVPWSRPIWSQRVNDTWECGGNIRGTVTCERDALVISRCYCMYYNSLTNKTELGTCLYSCFYPQVSCGLRLNRYLTDNFSAFNEDMCSPVISLRHRPLSHQRLLSHRVGRFCGQCEEGYGLAVYSYHLSSCIPCPHYRPVNWIKYLTIALGPLTVFYFLVVIFGVNLASGRMNGLIFSVQLLIAPANLIIMDADFHSGNVVAVKLIHTAVSMFAPVNLDFFRGLYPEFCIGPSLNVVHVLALDYVVAVYPFLLILLTYLLIKMYNKDYYVMVMVWKPFRYLLRIKNLNRHNTLVETFCTFTLLSSLKIVEVSISLLSAARVFNENGMKMGKNYLFYDASIEFFGPEHRYFGMLAILICFTFVFLPFFLLLLYPCKFFQRMLNNFGGKLQALHVFMDAFQGCYKITPIYLRSFSAYYLFLRFICMFVPAYFQSLSTLPILALVLMISTLIFATVQPYKDHTHNKLDLICLLVVTIFYASAASMTFVFYLDNRWIYLADFVFLSALFGTLVFYTVMVLYTMFGHHMKRACSICWRKVKVAKRQELAEKNRNVSDSDEHRSLLSYSHRSFN